MTVIFCSKIKSITTTGGFFSPSLFKWNNRASKKTGCVRYETTGKFSFTNQNIQSYSLQYIAIYSTPWIVINILSPDFRKYTYLTSTHKVRPVPDTLCATTDNHLTFKSSFALVTKALHPKNRKCNSLLVRFHF